MRRCVAMAGEVARGAVPHRAGGAGQVALRHAQVVVRAGKKVGLARLARLAAGRRVQAALSLVVVERADDDGAVDVVFHELHQHFLAADPQLQRLDCTDPATGVLQSDPFGSKNP